MMHASLFPSRLTRLQGRPTHLYNCPDARYQPSLSINTSYAHGVPLESCSSQSSHGTTGSYDSGPSNFSSPEFGFISPVESSFNHTLTQDTTVQTAKFKTGPSRPLKMPSSHRNSGSVSPKGYVHPAVPAWSPSSLHLEKANILTQFSYSYHCLASGCDYKTDRHTDLNRHYRAKHSCPQEEMYSCSYKGCTKDFKRKDHLRDHCKRVHYRDLPVEMGGTGGRLR